MPVGAELSEMSPEVSVTGYAATIAVNNFVRVAHGGCQGHRECGSWLANTIGSCAHTSGVDDPDGQLERNKPI